MTVNEATRGLDLEPREWQGKDEGNENTDKTGDLCTTPSGQGEGAQRDPGG